MSDSLISESPVYSFEILTEDGVFVVSPSGTRAITKRNGKLALMETISLTIIYDFGTNSEAQGIEFSPNEEYISFIDRVNVRDATIELNNKTIIDDVEFYYIVYINNIQNAVSTAIDLYRTAINYNLWSDEGDFLVSITTARNYLNVFPMERLFSESSSNQIVFSGPGNNEFDDPMCAFSPDNDSFAICKYNKLIIYDTKRWEVLVEVTCFEILGLLWLDNCRIVIWNNLGDFFVYLFSGDEQNNISLTCDTIRCVELSKDRNVLALATHTDQIELFTLDPWKKCFSIDVKKSSLEFRPFTGDQNLSRNCIHFKEPEDKIEFNGRKLLERDFIRTGSRVQLCPIIEEEENLKAKRFFYLKFSYGTRYLASVNPGIKNTVFIWNLKSGSLKNVISLVNHGFIKGIEWHCEEDILAIICLKLIVFWTPTRCYSINSSETIIKFNWIPLVSLIMCSITFKEFVYFVSLKPSGLKCINSHNIYSPSESMDMREDV